MQLFFLESLDETSDYFQFEKDESRHITKVLRKSKGDVLNITNGHGWIFEAEILEANMKSVQARIINKTQEPRASYRLHMAVAPTKSMDRFEWFLEKATEIGIAEITPIICDNSERKVVKKERLERIVLSAVKQSLKSYMPVINDPVLLKDLLQNTAVSSKFIAHCADGNKQPLQTVVEVKGDYLILIGPEGDFSVKEIESALKAGFIPVTLGKSRLRTETAAVVACHTVALINE